MPFRIAELKGRKKILPKGRVLHILKEVELTIFGGGDDTFCRPSPILPWIPVFLLKDLFEIFLGLKTFLDLFGKVREFLDGFLLVAIANFGLFDGLS